MKKILVFLGICLLVTAGWYFFLKPSDYTVNFTAKTTVGAVNQTLKVWNKSLENSEPITQLSLGELTQTLRFGDSVHSYNWNVSNENDSVVKVRLRAKDASNSLANRWKVITGNGGFVKQTKATAEDFFFVLNTHLEKTKVTIDGEAETPETYYAYVTLRTLQTQKAAGMMNNFNFVSNLMLNNGIVQKGSPFIEILNWDKKTDSIHFNFCFPVLRSENMPQHPEIKYGKRYAKKALKATYNGNYITSDRAWYALEDYARRNNIDIVLEPLEVFFNNPQMGGNEDEWKTDVYMPIQE